MFKPEDPMPLIKAEEITAAGYFEEPYDYRSNDGIISPIRYILAPQGGYQKSQERLQQFQILLSMAKRGGNFSNSGYGNSVEVSRQENFTAPKIANSSDDFTSFESSNLGNSKALKIAKSSDSGDFASFKNSILEKANAPEIGNSLDSGDFISFENSNQEKDNAPVIANSLDSGDFISFENSNLGKANAPKITHSLDSGDITSFENSILGNANAPEIVNSLDFGDFTSFKNSNLGKPIAPEITNSLDSGHSTSVENSNPENSNASEISNPESSNASEISNSSDHMLSTSSLNPNVTSDFNKPLTFTLSRDVYSIPSTVRYILIPQVGNQFQVAVNERKSLRYPGFSKSISLDGNNVENTNISESIFAAKTLERQQVPFNQYETLLNTIEENNKDTDFKQVENLNTTTVLAESSMPINSIARKFQWNDQSSANPISFHQLVPYWFPYHPLMSNNHVSSPYLVVNPLMYPIMPSYHHTLL